MDEVHKAWEAYLAEMREIDPRAILEGGNSYRLFCQGWCRSKVYHVELLRKFYFDRMNELDVKQDRP